MSQSPVGLLLAVVAGSLAAGPLGAQAPAESAATLATPTGTLAGTLLLPAGAARAPVALLIAGSGPTDRNGNSPMLRGANNSLRLLAEGLGAAGIATLRYDKRGIAASAAAGTKETELRFDRYVADAALWVAQLRADPRFSTITIIGHSEGSLVGMLAARNSDADAYVSIAGIARGAGDVLRDQLRPQLTPALYLAADSALRDLEAGRTREATPPALAALLRPSVQPYLISWLRYRPATELARLTVPVLLVQGTTDIQVGVEEAHSLQAAKPDATLRLIEGMNHIFKLVPGDRGQQLASYSDSTLAIAPQLTEVIAQFIHKVPRRSSP